MRTDIIALEDSEVIVIPARIMRERLNGDPELNMSSRQGCRGLTAFQVSQTTRYSRQVFSQSHRKPHMLEKVRWDIRKMRVVILPTYLRLIRKKLSRQERK